MGFYTEQLGTETQRAEFLGSTALVIAAWQVLSLVVGAIWHVSGTHKANKVHGEQNFFPFSHTYLQSMWLVIVGASVIALISYALYTWVKSAGK